MVDNDKFYIAASKNDPDVIEEFLKKGFDINKKDEFGQSALHIATKNNNVEIVKQLIENKVDLNVQNKQGYTATHLAVLYGHVEIVKILIESGADKNLVDANGNTLLWNAVMRYNDDDKIVKYLLEIGFDPTTENDSGISALKILSMPKNESIRYLFSKWL